MACSIWTWAVSCCVLAALTLGTHHSTEKAKDMTYWLSFSKYAHTGKDMEVKVCVSDATGPFTLKLELMDYYGNNIQDPQTFSLTATKEVQTVQFKIEESLRRRYYTSYLRARASGGKVFDGFERVYVQYRDRLSVFLQTDKGIYTPGQKVKFRALSMLPDLTVTNRPVNITIYDPRYQRIVYWENMESKDDTGVVQGELMLATEPNLGKWRIRADVGGVYEYKYFKVAEIEEPQFDVRIRMDKKYALTSQEKVTATILARYLHGTPVQGSGVVNVTMNYYYSSRKQLFILREFTLNDKGQAVVEFTTEELTELAFNNTYNYYAQRWPTRYTPAYLAARRRSFSLSYKTFKFVADVKDSLTEDVSTRTKTLKFYRDPFFLRYISPSATSFKSDLPINVYVEAVQPDYAERVENPEQYSVQFTMYYYRPWNNDIDGTYSTRYYWQRPPTQKQILRSKIVQLNNEALAVWEIDCHSLPEDATYVYIEAKSGNARTSRYISRYNSPSKTFLQLSMKSERAKVGKTIKIQAESNKDFGTFTYQVFTRSGMSLTKKMPPSSVGKKQQFEVTVTDDMYPVVDVVVFFEAEDGEVVADRLVLPVEGDMPNELTLKFKQTEVKPGSKANLDIRGSKGSTVFLLGLDKSIKMMSKQNDITRENLMEEVSQLSNRRVYWRNGQIYYYYYARDTDDVFNSASAGFITDGVVPGTYYLIDIPRKYRNLFTTTTTTSSTTTTTTTARPTTTTTTASTTTTPQPPSTTAQTTRRIITTRRTTTMRTTRSTTRRTTTPTTTTEEPEPEAPKPFDAPEKLKKLLPDTWLWDSVILNKNFETKTFEVPEMPTTWVVNAFAVHPDEGLSVANETVQLLAIKRLFFSLDLPPRAVRGEDVCLSVVTFNTENDVRQATLTLAKNSTGFDNTVVKLKGESRQVTRRSMKAVVRLGQVVSKERKSSLFCINPKVLGFQPVKVTLKNGKTLADSQVREFKVLPEGVKRSQSYPFLVEVNKNKKTYRSSVTLDIPSNFEKDSLKVYFQIHGNLLGITGENLRNLLRIPSSTGDQNVVNFAPGVYVYRYLKATNGLTKRMDRRIKMFLLSAYQTQLKFRRYDGAFSAFGNSDSAGSVWITASVLKSLAQAAKLGSDVFTVDFNVINRAVYWLQRQQDRNGSFIESGRVFHPKMKSKSLALTAFVAIALKEVSHLSNMGMYSYYSSRVSYGLRQAVSFLEKNIVQCGDDAFDATIVAYALTLTGSSKAADAIRTMDSLVTRQGNLKYWSAPMPVKTTRYAWYRHVNPLSIEMTSYALMTYTLKGRLSEELAVFRWLNNQRGPYGGFYTLPDTIVGFEALSQTNALALGGDFSPIEVEISWVCGPGMDRKATVTIDKKSLNSLQEVELPVEGDNYPQSVTVTAKSTTTEKNKLFAFGQVFLYYNLASSTSRQSFLALTTVRQNKAKTFNLTTCVCRTTMRNVNGPSVAVAKIAFPSGFDVDRQGSDFGAAGHVEFLDRKAILYYASLSMAEECSVLRLRMTKGSVANHKPVPVRVFDLYAPDNEYTTTYSINQYSTCQVEPNYMDC